MTPAAESFGEVVYPPGGRLGPRRQTSFELVTLFTGSMTVRVDGAPRAAGARTACVLLPGHEERFAFSPTQATHHAWIRFHDDPPDAALLQRLAALPGPVALSPELAAQMRRLLDLEHSLLTTRAELQHLLARQALQQYVGEAELAGGRVAQLPDPLRRALDAVEADLQAPLSVERLAAAAAVSRAHLIRLFGRELDTTPMAYVWRRRLERGLRLLEESGLPIGEVARRSGFGAPEHFYRRVRAETGLGPAAYRERRWAPGAQVAVEPPSTTSV